MLIYFTVKVSVSFMDWWVQIRATIKPLVSNPAVRFAYNSWPIDWSAFVLVFRMSDAKALF